MLVLFRRHLRTCPHKPKGRSYRRCKCPVYVDGIQDGIDVRQSLKTDSWEEGERKLEKLRASPDGLLLKPKLVSEACDLFLADLRGGQKLSPETERKYRDIFKQLNLFCYGVGKTYLKQLQFEDMAAFRSSWPDAALSASKKLERLKSFLSFCVKAGWIEKSPADGLRRPKVIDIPTMPFTQAQMTDIFTACAMKYTDNYGRVGMPNSQRLLALTLVLRYSGIRMIDAVCLSENEVIQQPDGTANIFLQQQKTGEPVTAPIPSAVLDALRRVPGRTSSHYFFWSGQGDPKSATRDWQRSFRKLFRVAGISHIPDEIVKPKYWQRRLTQDGSKVRAHPHMFRDTFAVELLVAGTPIEDVSKLLGHTSIRTTERSYAPWVKVRQQKLQTEVRKSWNLDQVLLAMIPADRKAVN